MAKTHIKKASMMIGERESIEACSEEGSDSIPNEHKNEISDEQPKIVRKMGISIQNLGGINTVRDSSPLKTLSSFQNV